MKFLLPGALFAGALLLVIPPASAQEPSSYDAGVAARLAGHPDQARQILATWVARNPGDADARLQLAYAELALGNLDAAQAGFEEVLRIAPGYSDVHDGLAAVAGRRAASPRGRRASLVLEGALSDLSGGAPGWRELALDGEVAASALTSIGGRAAYYRRFGRDDAELVGRVGLHPSPDLWLRASVGGTPHADFRPSIQAGGGLDVRVARTNATVLTFDAAWQRYRAQGVVVLQPGVVQYVAGGEAWLTLRGIGAIVDGGSLQVGGLVRADYSPATDWRLFVGASNGPDTDLGVVTRVTGLFGGVEAPLGNRLGITTSIARETRKAGFSRTEFRLGLKARL